MNPFTHPEFWLSLAFIVVLGMIVFSPVRHLFQKFFDAQRNQILNKINQVNSALLEAKELFQEEQKKAKIKPDLKNEMQQIKAIQQEFLQKMNHQIQLKKQDYQTRLKLTEIQVKNHLRDELLKKTEKNVLKSPVKKTLNQEIKHFLQMLEEREDQIRKSFS